MRIVFFGSGPFALPALERLHALTADQPLVRVVTRPDRPQARGRKVLPTPVRTRSAALGIACDAPDTANDQAYLASLAALKPDLFVVADYGEMLRKPLRELPRLGIFNLHGSVLPRWRGAAPVVHAILGGDKESGVTLFRIERGLDSGPIVDSTSVTIGELETAGELEARLAANAADLLERNLPRLSSGAVLESPQDESLATLAPKVEKQAAQIDWSAPAEHVSRQVRAYNPWPGAFSFLGGERTVLLRARPITADPLPGTFPGAVMSVRKGAFAIRCGVGAVEVLELQREGKSPLSTPEYLRGRPLRDGDRFEAAAAHERRASQPGAGAQRSEA